MTNPSPPPGVKAAHPWNHSRENSLPLWRDIANGFFGPPTRSPILTTPAFLHSSAIVSVAKQFHPIFLLINMLLVHR
jgi:hypothetical protein